MRRAKEYTSVRKKAVLKTWLRKLIAGGCYQQIPRWVQGDLVSRGVPVQAEAERFGLKWGHVTYLMNRLAGVKVDGEAIARKVLAELEVDGT